MTKKQSKVIHSFGERLALDKDVLALADAPNTTVLEKSARELAAKGGLVLPVLLRRLDTSNARLRGGLGLVAQFMDADIIVPALRRFAADPSRSDAARLTAVMILERYLEIPLDAALAQILPEPTDIAGKSALEALELAKTDPLILVEYAEQLLEEPDDVIDSVLAVIMELDLPERARLLATIVSFGDKRQIASVLPALAGIRHPASLEGLITLSHLADPDLRPSIERQIRKLQMRGVRLPVTGDLRVLWSPFSAQGQSYLWLMRYHTESNQADFLALAFHDETGVFHGEAHPQMQPEGLPMPAPLGHVHQLRIPDSKQVVGMIEISPDRAECLLAESIRQAHTLDLPWPAELVVFGHWLWGRKQKGRVQCVWPEVPPTTEPMPADENDLLSHIAFQSWLWELPDINQLLRTGDVDRALQVGSAAHQAVCERLVNAKNAPLLAQRLQYQIRWLLLAGDTHAATQAQAAHDAILAGLADAPFVQALAWRSLLSAAASRVAKGAFRLLK